MRTIGELLEAKLSDAQRRAYEKQALAVAYFDTSAWAQKVGFKEMLRLKTLRDASLEKRDVELRPKSGFLTDCYKLVTKGLDKSNIFAIDADFEVICALLDAGKLSNGRRTARIPDLAKHITKTQKKVGIKTASLTLLNSGRLSSGSDLGTGDTNLVTARLGVESLLKFRDVDSSINGDDLSVEEEGLLKVYDRKRRFVAGLSSDDIKAKAAELTRRLSSYDKDMAAAREREERIRAEKAAAEKAEAEKKAAGNFSVDEVTRFLSGLRTKTAGRLKRPEWTGAEWLAEPENRERLDHYGSSEDDEDGWDSEGWDEDYASPLRDEIVARLEGEFGADLFDVEIDDKGYVGVYRTNKGLQKIVESRVKSLAALLS
jgi:hypothetical protein